MLFEYMLFLYAVIVYEPSILAGAVPKECGKQSIIYGTFLYMY
jgi:hypothetical protein